VNLEVPFKTDREDTELTGAFVPLRLSATREEYPAMALEEDIIKLLKSEGFKMNEAIRDALDEFLDTVNEENEDMDDDLSDEDGGGEDDEDN
jgi:hypothetical protein